jgi:hypothetical protein
MIISKFPTRSKRFLLIATLLMGAIPATSALAARASDGCDAQSEPYVLHVTTREVVLDIIATDSHGHPVRDLAAKELSIFELPKGSKKQLRNLSGFRMIDPSTEKDAPSDATTSAGFHVTVGGGCAIATTFHYQLAFQPTSAGFTSGYHEVLVTTSRPHVNLAFHSRYYVGETALPSKPRVQQNANSEAELQQAACTHALTPPSIALKASLIQNLPSEPLRYVLNVQPDSLGFASLTDESRRVQLDYAACAFDQDGIPISYQHSSAERILSPQEYERIRSTGYSNLIELSRKGDPALVRFVVRDRETGNLGLVNIATAVSLPVFLTREEKEKAGKFAVAQAKKGNTADPSAGFGSVVPKPGALCGDVYELPENTLQMPSSFWGLDAVGAVYAYALDQAFQYVTNGIPGVTSRPNWFAIDYHGKFWVQDPGDYQFVLTSDDGHTLIIDDQQLIHDDQIHTETETKHAIHLAAGSHTIQVSYFQGPERAALRLQVKPPGKSLRLFDLRDFAPPSTAKVSSPNPALPHPSPSLEIPAKSR